MKETTYTLATLQERQEALQKQLNDCKAQISKRWDLLTAQPKENNKPQHWMNQIERAFIIYDGAMTGYKLFRRFNTIAGIFKKKKKH